MNENGRFPNRAVQRKILERLLEEYPEQADTNWESEFPDLVKEMAYLHEHGLVRALFSGHMGSKQQVVAAELTHEGVDFLQQDGGLAAILGVVTIRLHDDTIKSLVESRIQASDLPPADKKQWIDRLRSLPADATKHLVLKLVDMGLEKGGPATIALIGTLLQSAA